MSAYDESIADQWFRELRGCLDSSSAHFDRTATVYRAVDTIEAMLADRVAEAERLAGEHEAAIKRAEATEAVARGARSLWTSMPFCAPEAIGSMAATKIGVPVAEWEQAVADAESREQKRGDLPAGYGEGCGEQSARPRLDAQPNDRAAYDLSRMWDALNEMRETLVSLAESTIDGQVDPDLRRALLDALDAPYEMVERRLGDTENYVPERDDV